ncbi:MAG TPA: MFS transporter [Solirubrobacteraceae bacterium]|nr:MFS transporter [Solirubrobacteraceae bacterium]
MALRSTQGRWLMLVTVLGSGMAFLDGTIINVALPTIGRDFHASTSSLQWILSGYLLTLASLILLGGSLGDRFGRRRVFVLGAGVFSSASLLCALAPSAPSLIAARLVQGVGGALLTPGSLAMIEANVRRQDRARVIGAWSGMTGVATALGPLLGGYLIGAVSWRAAFLINVPLGAIVVLAAREVGESRDTQAHERLDVRGVALAALALAGTTYALIDGPNVGATIASIAPGAVGVVALAAFLLAERRSPTPMLPLEIFSPQFSAANLITFVVYTALGGVFFLLVAFLQISMGYSPVGAGAASLPVTVLMLCLSAASGSLAQRIGPRIPLTLGSLMIAAGMLLMTRIDPGDSYPQSVLPAVVVFGLGLTLVVSPVTATVLAAASERHSGIASGVNNAVARVASLLAVAVLPLLAGLGGHRFYVPTAMTHGFHVAMLVCACIAAAGAVLAYLTINDDVLAAADDSGEDTLTSATAFSCAVTGPPAGLQASARDMSAAGAPR